MSWQRTVVLLVLLGTLAFVWFRWRGSAVTQERTADASAATVEKQPIHFSSRVFNPADPPPDMPPLAYGENALCDSNFLSNADVSGETQQTDDTHGIVTVTHVNVALQLNVTIWLPDGATQHVSEHEDGHRQISEHYYQTADRLAQRIAQMHVGEQVAISGADLQAESSKALQQVGNEIADEYNKELDPELAQLRYDAITDHSRNDVAAQDAVAQALKEADAAPAEAATTPRN